MAKEVGFENICRYEGEEFLALLPAGSLDEIGGMAENLKRALNDFGSQRGTPELTVSIGAAPKGELTFYETLPAADTRLCAAKNGGKNKTSCKFT